jgi:hypothetical protein
MKAILEAMKKAIYALYDFILLIVQKLTKEDKE